MAYQLYASSKSISHKKKRRNNRITVPFIFLAAGFYFSYRDNNYLGIIFFGIASILWFITFPKYSRWRYRKHFKNHVEENYKNRIHRPVEIDFDEKSMYAKDGASESKINGSELKELIETKKHFFLKLATDESIIIPKHAIEDQTKFKTHVTKLGVEYVNELNWEWR